MFERNAKAIGCLALAAVGLVGLAGRPTYGYNPPDGPNFNVAGGDLHAHGKITVQAIDVLGGDGLSEMKAFYEKHKQALLNGVRQGDRSHGDVKLTLSVLGKNVKDQMIERNSMSHFYNPNTGKGFVLTFGEPEDTLIAAARGVSLGGWELTTFFGPHPAATDMADWAYAQAVDAMRKGDTNRAMEHLGWVLHYTQDLTVPQHATDQGGNKTDSLHLEYETASDKAASDGNFPHARSGGIYNDTQRPGQFVEFAAKQSAPLLSKARVTSSFREVQEKMIPLAERLCAGQLARFYRQWRTENFNVVIVTVNRVRDLTGDIDSGVSVGPEADFYARVKIDGKTYQTGVIDGGDDIQPQKLVPYCWVFPKWISKPRPLQASTVEPGATPRGYPAEAPTASQVRLATFEEPQARPNRPSRRSSFGGLGRRPVYATNTKLEMWNGITGEFKDFVEDVFIESDRANQRYNFLWETKEAGAKSGVWQVSASPFPASANNWQAPTGLLESGPSALPTAPSKFGVFEVDFKQITAKAPAHTGATRSFYARLVMVDAQGQAVGNPSNQVEITYGKNDQPGTVFDIPSDASVHPKARIISYGPLGRKTANGVNVAGILTLEIRNPGNTATDPVTVVVKDNNRFFKRDTGLAIPSMKPHERIERRFIMEPDLVYWKNEMLKKYQNVNPSGGEVGFWSQNFRETSSKVDFEVRTTTPETKKYLDSNRLSSKLSVRAALPYPEPVSVGLEIWDKDGGANGGDDHCDIHPATGFDNVDVSYRFDGIIEWSQSPVEGEGYRTNMTSAGNQADKAEVSFSVERLPIPPAPIELKISPRRGTGRAARPPTGPALRAGLATPAGRIRPGGTRLALR